MVNHGPVGVLFRAAAPQAHIDGFVIGNKASWRAGVFQKWDAAEVQPTSLVRWCQSSHVCFFSLGGPDWTGVLEQVICSGPFQTQPFWDSVLAGKWTRGSPFLASTLVNVRGRIWGMSRKELTKNLSVGWSEKQDCNVSGAGFKSKSYSHCPARWDWNSDWYIATFWLSVNSVYP